MSLPRGETRTVRSGRRTPSRLGACLRAALILACAAAGLAAELSSPATAQAPPCTLDASVHVEPERVAFGESVTISMELRPWCEGPPTLRVMALVDGSGSMAGAPLNQAKRQIGVLRTLLRDAKGGAEVALLPVGGDQQKACPFTTDAEELWRCADGLRAAGSRAIGPGIERALGMLVDARPPAGAPTAPTEVMIVLGQGDDVAGCSGMLPPASEVRAAGVLLVTVCVQPGCDSACMRQVATSPRYHFDAQSAGLDHLFRGPLLGTVATGSQMVMADWPAEEVNFVEDSAIPPAQRVGAGGRGRQWQVARPSVMTHRFLWRAQPRRSGRMPLTRGATVSLTDWSGRDREFELQPPEVLVDSPSPSPTRPTPTATAPRPPSATATPTPPHTPTARPSPPSPPPPLPSPERLYLPLARHDPARP